MTLDALPVMKLKTLATLLSVFAVVPAAVRAQEYFANNPHYYADFFLGGTKFDYGYPRPLLNEHVRFNDTRLSWKLDGGYQINPYIGLTLGYMDLGRVKLKGSFDPGPAIAPFTGPFTGSIDTSAWTLAVTGTLPVTSRFALFAKGGTYDWTTKLRYNEAGLTRTDDRIDFLTGIGASYQLTSRVSALVDTDLFLGKDRNVTLWTGVRYGF